MAETGILSRVGERMADLLSEDTPAAPPHNPVHGLLSRDEFERCLGRTARETGRSLAGAVDVIGLSKVRDSFGDRWEKLAARADELARRAIERRLDDADVYTRQGELQYVVLFAHLTEEQARLKCRVIADEIARLLLGEDVAPALAEVRTAVSHAYSSATSLDALAARLGAEPVPKEPEDDWWDSDSAADPLDSIRLAYRPLWDVRHNALAHYVCTPVVSGPAGKLLLGEDGIAAGADAAAVNRLDMLMQRQVIGDLRHLLATGRKLLLCLPVHFETLASTSRRTPYLDRCRRGIPQGGERFLAFELVGTPPGAPQGRLLEMASALKRHARAVFLRVRHDHATFRHPTETGIAAMGFTCRVPSDERSVVENLQRFALAAKKAGVVPYVRGLGSLSLTTSAIGAGFEFVDGDVISGVTASPQNAYQFGIEDLFTRQIGVAS